MSRHKAREAAFQMLFQLIEGANDWKMAEHTLAQAELPQKSAAFAVVLAQGAWQKHFETEQYIRRLAKGWQYERLCSVDRLLLHLSMYELKYLPDSPPPIVIDEAIELAREFGTDDSPSFINAVLDKFVHAVLTDKAADYQLDEVQIEIAHHLGGDGEVLGRQAQEHAQGEADGHPQEQVFFFQQYFQNVPLLALLIYRFIE